MSSYVTEERQTTNRLSIITLSLSSVMALSQYLTQDEVRVATPVESHCQVSRVMVLGCRCFDLRDVCLKALTCASNTSQKAREFRTMCAESPEAPLRCRRDFTRFVCSEDSYSQAATASNTKNSYPLK